MVSGWSPKGESLPPSRLNPNPAPSLTNVTVTGGPLDLFSVVSSGT